LESYRQEVLSWKKRLNLEFFKKYYRYISEGTWTNADYTDDEKYYIDAKAVAYNSSLPKITYNINVLSLETIPGYEHFSIELADKTWIEDTEYFGYDLDGNPYREEVVVTEVVYALDEPDKDTIKVQNHKTQFQDLFQRITAQTQSVQFSSGDWDNAADFTSASAAEQSKFLNKALNYADTVLTNSGE
jgi:hypothetical protein